MKTILVVDDMAICREAVAETLRAAGYQVICAGNGVEALTVLETQPVQLVVLDLQMPQMDGLEALTRIKENPAWRSLAVILLTDDAQAETVRRAVGSGVNGYILKATFDPGDLLSRVRRCLGPPITLRPAVRPRVSGPPTKLRSPPPPAERSPSESEAGCPPKLDREQVLKQIRRGFSLQPIHPVLQHILAQTRSKESSIHDVVDTLRKDQALALRTIKVANSAYYAPIHPARNLMEAASRIGMAGIRNAVVTLLSIDHFCVSENVPFNHMRFWDHSLGTAFLTQTIAERLRLDQAEDLFLAGLLHDIGRLVLACAFPTEYQHIVNRGQLEGANLLHLERETFGIGHDGITREVLATFDLAEAVVMAAALHEEEPRRLAATSTATGAKVVALADRLAHAFILGDSGNPVLYAYDQYGEMLSLGVSQVRAIANDVLQKISDTSLFFAAQGEVEQQTSLVEELSQQAMSLKTVVLATDAPDDPLSIFLGRIGRLDNENPESAVAYARGPDEVSAIATSLQKAEGRFERKLPTTLIWADAEQLRQNTNLPFRPREQLCLPLSYAAILQRLTPTAHERHQPARPPSPAKT